jgi:IMP and pyridine-specific 5'-nucleotidase
MLQHSFVLDSLETTAADTFEHFEQLVDEHRERQDDSHNPSRLRQLVPTIGIFHTHLPLRAAFDVYNEKTQVTKRKHIQIS